MMAIHDETTRERDEAIARAAATEYLRRVGLEPLDLPSEWDVEWYGEFHEDRMGVNVLVERESATEEEIEDGEGNEWICVNLDFAATEEGTLLPGAAEARDENGNAAAEVMDFPPGSHPSAHAILDWLCGESDYAKALAAIPGVPEALAAERQEA